MISCAYQSYIFTGNILLPAPGQLSAGLTGRSRGKGIPGRKSISTLTGKIYCSFFVHIRLQTLYALICGKDRRYEKVRLRKRARLRYLLFMRTVSGSLQAQGYNGTPMSTKSSMHGKSHMERYEHAAEGIAGKCT